MSCPSSCPSFLTSTIGKKYLVALSAIFWCLFVMLHMLGNMLIFVGAEAYNKYSHSLTSNPIIYLIEIILVFLLLVHIFLALGLKIRSWRSKPKLYAVKAIRAKSSAISSRTMAYTGLAILGFIIWHLITFKYGVQYFVYYQGLEMRDLYKLVYEKFHDPIYVILYTLSMLLIGMHLFHGVKSIFQSLGINHPRYNAFIKYFGCSYAIIVSIGFLSQPIYVYFLR